ncbi:hypothetical protein BCR33DRAFT_717732 [Rhizoclosmatium globosum]|uniref:Uncharacterized protein n=1 Tax=Rhizoclosmatium globosum TaxID=329046 RepID=A0A1Y2C9L4_9FUNG|nr:hypothetical protein BCR33DRAFT_717732 [Rhizoclosmatium globosum]|eukprot:ORY43005.1 hypothetical protein BCR33DRAFT_717732 [Rhizoclosmatium globosum]
MQVAKLLLKDPRIDLNNAGNLFPFFFSREPTLVKLFLEDERINPAVNNNRALRIAARNNHAHVVSLLLQDPHVDPSDCWDVLREAAEFCRTDIVRILLANPRVDPGIHNNAAIRRALVRWEYITRMMESMCSKCSCRILVWILQQIIQRWFIICMQ